MSNEFYQKALATANRMIVKYGRPIVLEAKSRTPSDSDQPWDGVAPTGGEVFNCNGVFVPPNTVRQFGITALGLGTEFEDLFEMSEQIAICNSGDVDVRDYRTLVDSDAVNWGIIGIQQLKPATIGILSFIAVRR